MLRHTLMTVCAGAMLFVCTTLLTGCESATDAAVGAYALDKQETAADMRARIDAMDDEAEKQMYQMMLGMIEEMDATLVLSDDMTARLSMTIGGQPDHSGGTWRLEGEDLYLTLEADTGDPETARGTLRDDVIVLMPALDDDTDITLTFNKQIDR